MADSRLVNSNETSRAQHIAIQGLPVNPFGQGGPGASMITDMVVPRSDITVQPGLNNFSSFNIQSFPGTKIKLVPRNGTTPLWREEFNDLLSNCKRSHIIAMKGPPILTEFSASFLSRYPDTPAQQVMTAYAHEYMLYLQHNTDVYHLLRASMLMQGPSVEADIKLFHEHFHLNDYRDGKGLYTWATTQVPAPLSISAQSDLLDTFQNAKLSENATVSMFSTHCTALFNTRGHIIGNVVSRPASYYHKLMASIPTKPDACKLVLVRNWMTEKLTDAHPITLTPPVFIDRSVMYAKALGMNDSQSGGGVLAVGEAPPRGNDATVVYRGPCKSKLCACNQPGSANVSKSDCVCHNSKVPFGKDASEGAKAFVKLMRAYLVIKPSANLLDANTTTKVIRDAVKAAKPKGQITATGAEATPPATVEVPAGSILITTEQADNLKQFTSWVESINGKSVLMIQCDTCYDNGEPLITHLPDGDTLLSDCVFCHCHHSPDFPWCALSLGMSLDVPVMAYRAAF